MITSCLVNPRACHETELNLEPTSENKKIGVIGAGPAGLAFAISAAERGHNVTLFDSANKIGGQFNVARKIPGKQEFNETLRYYSKMIELTNVNLKLNTKISVDELNSSDFDEVIIATGVTPRQPKIPGIENKKVVSYLDVLNGEQVVGGKVAVIGAGGIGFDVCEYLTHSGIDASQNIKSFMELWGVDMNLSARGGLIKAKVPPSPREVYLLQRKSSKVGAGLGKTTGWIHRAGLINKKVNMIAGCEYVKIDDNGLHIKIGNEVTVLDVDNIVVCAGQNPLRDLSEGLQKPYHLIGGADVASELDAKRAIDQGTRLASVI